MFCLQTLPLRRVVMDGVTRFLGLPLRNWSLRRRDRKSGEEALQRHSKCWSKSDDFEPSTATPNHLGSSPNFIAGLVWPCKSHVRLIFPQVALQRPPQARRSSMPDIDPAALSRPSISTTPILPPKTISASAPIVPKVSKSSHVPPRIDLEPLYTALKSAIGEHWGTYKESISLFVMGS
jgi:hypothetical protein